jgi:hypothetical protein
MKMRIQPSSIWQETGCILAEICQGAFCRLQTVCYLKPAKFLLHASCQIILEFGSPSSWEWHAKEVQEPASLFNAFSPSTAHQHGSGFTHGLFSIARVGFGCEMAVFSG